LLLQTKIEQQLPPTLKSTDVVLIVITLGHKAQSFAICKNNTKAILDRGWVQTNRALEVYPDILRTKKLCDNSNALYISTKTSMLASISCNIGHINNTNMGAAAILLEAMNKQ
jgi:hypothetical protein